MRTTPSALERAAARNLVKNYLRVKPGENVIVESWSHTIPMSSAMVDEVRRLGGGAFMAYENDDAWWRAVERGQAKLLGRLSAPEWAALRAADVFVQFWGPEDSDRLDKLPEQRLDDWADGWFDRWYRIARSTGLRGGRMATGWVTDARARKWGVRKERWRSGLLRACLADPKEIATSGTRLARAFRGTEKVRITHPNGTDVELALAGVPPRVFNGHPHPGGRGYGEYDMMANFPEGRLGIALDTRTAEGRLVATNPSYEEVWFPWTTFSGGTFDFSGGKLTSFSFAEGQRAFAERYARGSPGKDRPGTLRIGLHPTIHGLPYLEEMERGSVQISVGRNAYLGGRNPSDFAGRLSLAGAEVRVGGTLVVRAGKIL